jgi:rhodanese-related sulfurtransferase
MSPIDEISPEEAFRRLGSFHSIDVRGAHEFHGPLGHIEGSVLLPLPDLTARADELPDDRPLLMVCRSGGRSGKACELLAERGRGPSVNLAGGMIAWNQLGLPVVPFEPARMGELLENLVRWVVQVSSFSQESANDFVGERLDRFGADRREPTRAVLECVLEDFEISLGQSEPPADLYLSMASFRRTLAVL